MTDEAELIAAVEADATLREGLTDTFNARARSLGWIDYARDGTPSLRPSAREAAFEFALGIHAGLQAAGLPGFNGMELMVASARGADFIFPLKRENEE